MARVYATRADLVAYAATSGGSYDVPSEPAATAMLTRASAYVETLITEPYDVDSVTLLPTDTDVTAALRDATCAVVLGHLGEATATGTYTTVSIGSVTLTGPADSSSTSGSGVLEPDPLAELGRAGLVSPWVATAR